jgi:hypothetical protein
MILTVRVSMRGISCQLAALAVLLACDNETGAGANVSLAASGSGGGRASGSS